MGTEEVEEMTEEETIVPKHVLIAKEKDTLLVNAQSQEEIEAVMKTEATEEIEEVIEEEVAEEVTEETIEEIVPKPALIAKAKDILLVNAQNLEKREVDMEVTEDEQI